MKNPKYILVLMAILFSFSSMAQWTVSEVPSSLAPEEVKDDNLKKEQPNEQPAGMVIPTTEVEVPCFIRAKVISTDHKKVTIGDKVKVCFKTRYEIDLENCEDCKIIAHTSVPGEKDKKTVLIDPLTSGTFDISWCGTVDADDLVNVYLVLKIECKTSHHWIVHADENTPVEEVDLRDAPEQDPNFQEASIIMTSIYPNPSNGNFDMVLRGLEKSTVQIQVFSMTGALVKDFGVKVLGNNEEHFNLQLPANTPAGNYLLVAISEKRTVRVPISIH